MINLRLWLRRLLLGTLVAAGLGIVGASWYFHAKSASPAQGSPTTESGVICFGYVDVKHGVRSLSPLRSGRVVEVVVEENASVPADAVLIRLDDRPARLRVDEARAALAAAQAQAAQARAIPQQQQARKAQLDAAIDSAAARLESARDIAKHKQNLFDQKLLSAEELGAAKGQVREAEGVLRAEKEKLAELVLHDPARSLEQAEAEVTLHTARLRLAEQIVEEHVVRAPAAGKVLRILVGPGDIAGPDAHQTALLFLPEGPRFVRAEVEQEFVAQVTVGQHARIEDETGNRIVSGSVLSISDWFTQRRTILQEPLQFNDARTLEVIIATEQGGPPLRIGQRVRVWIGSR